MIIHLYRSFAIKFFDILEENINYSLKKVIKGVWRMPWHLKAMKDVISCDKLR
jgi:hypothetical protein